MNRVWISWLLIAQSMCYASYGQYYIDANNRAEADWLWEIGVSADAMNCLTDIGGHRGKGSMFVKDVNASQTEVGFALMASACHHYQFGIRLQAMAGSIAGADNTLAAAGDAARNRYLRNLSFRTALFEASVLGEIYPLQLLFPSRDIPLLSPYLLAGIGVFHYNPQGKLNGRWVSLRPLHTEGEGFPEYPDRPVYQPYSWCIPAGAGIKYDAGNNIKLRLEINYRLTGTDYLDDVSRRYIDPGLWSKYLSASQLQLALALADRSGELKPGTHHAADEIRGNPSSKDAYFSLALKGSIALGRVGAK